MRYGNYKYNFSVYQGARRTRERSASALQASSMTADLVRMWTPESVDPATWTPVEVSTATWTTQTVASADWTNIRGNR
jgi:hypothetical protein